MSCNKLTCMFVGNKYNKINPEKNVDNLSNIEKQLDKCNKCVGSEVMEDTKNKTRNIVGSTYVSVYWEGHREKYKYKK